VTTLPPQFGDILRTDNAKELVEELKKEKSSSLALTDEETVIRRFYAGISEGINGNDAGWEQAWNQCSAKQRKRYIGLRPDEPTSAAARDILKPLYRDSSSHNVLHVSEYQRVSDSQAVYLVMYRERKEALPSRLHFKFFEDPDVTAAKFYSMFPDARAAFGCIVNDIGNYYHFESSAKKYSGLSEELLRNAITSELANLSLKRLFGGNLIFELGTLFQLERKEEQAGFHRSEGAPRPFDIGYVLNVHLQREGGQWRITRFEPNSTIYVNVLK
jgi:hypothetical protein